MPRNNFMIPELEAPRVSDFLRELGDLSRKYKLALNGDPIVFEMEPEDMGGVYRLNTDGFLIFG